VGRNNRQFENNKTYGIFGFKAAQKIIAGLQLNINQVDGTLRVFGPRAARSTLGLNPYTNWIKPANVSNILQSADEFKLSKLSNISTFLGLSLNIASNSVDLAQGDIDRFEYAAALTVDTGITAGSALLAGALSGAAIGFLVGGAAGAGVGAIPGAIAGGIVGAVVAIGGTSWLNSSGLRDSWVDSVADMYRKWVE
jgi:hypothetical protein